jgi:hypothetical protein
MGEIFIGGTPFMALSHRDGRFVRASGVFAFARREPDGTYRVLHLDIAGEINRQAGPGHPRWAWALSQGMDALLVHLFGRPARIPPHATADLETVRWHPQAQVAFLSAAADADLTDDGQVLIGATGA